MPKRPQLIQIRSRSKDARCPRPEPVARLPQFIGCPVDAGAALSRLKVAVVGAGAVGGRTATDLARLAPAALFIVDPKSFKPESVATTDIGSREIGKSKAVSVARRCQAISPATRVW